MMTEEEAKVKWCPFARQLEGYAEKCSLNRNVDDEPRTFCIASACMAWRWHWRLEDHHQELHGFCGLAGEPR